MTVAARQAWLESLAARRAGRRRFAAWATAAATVVLLAAVGLWLGRGVRGPATGAEIASVERVLGAPLAALGDGDRRLQAGATVRIGERLITGPQGAVALRWGGDAARGSSVRLDADSAARLVSATELELLRGAVYLASASGATGAAAGALPDVVTALGRVSDIGTQYEARLLGGGDDELRVRVREGEVRLTGAEAAVPEAALRVAAGSEAVLAASGELTRRSIPTSGELWRWMLDAAPPFAAADADLGQFLAWLERETGWRIEIEDARLRERLHRIDIHVPPDLTPRDAADNVLRSVGLRGELRDGVFALRPE